MIKALFFDIDGTLVSFKTHQVPETTIEALVAARSKGLRVFISTGRPKVIINNLQALQERNLIDGYVSMNGAYCFIDNQVISSNSIPHQSALALADYAKRENIPTIFVSAEKICVINYNHVVKDIFYDYLHVDNIPKIAYDETIEDEIYQMTPFITVEQETKIMPLLKGCISSRWHPAFTDITAAGSDKKHGVEMISKHFGFSREEVMCFGDGGNDISMLQYAGIGVAMDNAEDMVKAEADYITTSVDDNGVRNALRHFNLI
jgi:Cof subfamily protein (haloacid dehalogenase superfamily)